MGGFMLSPLKTRPPGGATVLFAKSRFPLHAMLTSAGYDRRESPPYDWHGLRRGESPFVLLQHTIAGRGQLRYERRRSELNPGETLLLQFPHDNRYWLGRGDRWEFFWLCLNGREVLRVWREALALHGPVVRLAPPAIERLAGLCLSVLDGNAASAPRASAIAYEAAMCVAEELLPRQPAIGTILPAEIERILALCRMQLSDPALDVERLASAAGYSRYHFTRLFAASVGVPPARYVMQARMEEAIRQLRRGNVSVKQVADRCGFVDANYFGKVFRRFFGINPRDFRRSGAFGGNIGRL